MVDGVLFDVGGVLVLPDPGRVADAVAGLACVPVTPAKVHRAHYRGVAVPVELAEEHTGDHWPMRLENYVACFIDELGIRPEESEAARKGLVDLFEGPAYGLWCWVQEAAVLALHGLVERGVRLGVVSNADGSIERQLADAGICQLGPGPDVEVHSIIDSGVVGVAKPDPAIFAFALDELDLTADRVLFIGDTPAVDFAGGTAAGIRTVIIDPYRLSGLPEQDTVHSVADLLELI
ncbi:MAG: HAD family hydrolase [Acidobacteria bacterium]|nr:HAD family hydrolase [Acidobacteriota bacterium]